MILISMKFFEMLFGSKKTGTDPIEEPVSRNLMNIDAGRESDGGLEQAKKIHPKDWKTKIALSLKWPNSPSSISEAAEKYREAHPEWFGSYLSSKLGAETEYYHPSLINKLEEDLKVREMIEAKVNAEKAPEGWKTASHFQIVWGITPQVGVHAAEKYREAHPEWFGSYWSSFSKRIVEYYHPDLFQCVEKDLKLNDIAANKDKSKQAPEGWKAPPKLEKMWTKRKRAISEAAEKYREAHPEWFGDYWSNRLKKEIEYYHPDLVIALEIDLKIKEHKEGKEVLGKAPEGWKTPSVLQTPLASHEDTVIKAAEKYREAHPEWFHNYWSYILKKDVEHYHSDLIAQLRRDLKVDERAAQKAPQGWQLVESLTAIWGGGKKTVIKAAEKYREAHPEWFHDYWSTRSGKLVEHYHSELVSKLKEDLKIEEREAKKAPNGWRTYASLLADWGASPSSIKREAEKYRDAHPEWFHNYWSMSIAKEIEFYHPDLIVQLKQDLKIDERDALRQKFGEAPDDWKTSAMLIRKFGSADKTIKKAAEKYREAHPEWFHVYFVRIAKNTSEFYHPELIAQLEIDLNISEKKERKDELKMQIDLRKTLHEIEQGVTEFAAEFRSLLKVFGASRCVDVLFQFRPEYRALKHDYVKGLISEYLGDCLNAQSGMPPDKKGLLLAIEQLSSPELQDGLYETMKDDCYHFLLNQQKIDPKKDRLKTTVEYKDHLRSRSGAIDHPIFNAIVDRVVKYYTDLWRSYEKPPRFVEALKTGREFPDINQRINIKELEDKKRLVIADEMGVGKSASVIMAKEHLGLQCALVVVPSNVVGTWKNYLSDNPEGGYFKPGQAPSILVVESSDQLAGVKTASYEYILVSHERLTERYTEGLLDIPYDMLIVDEYHKLKSLKGVRSEKLMRLAGKIDKQEEKEGEAANEEPEKYLALLSGTPVPNKVQDIALSLKLLYPERFGKTEDSQLVLQILKGDILNLRSLLLPRLQMKSLRDAVEMPPLTEELIEIELGELEREIYQVFLEDDELASTEKLTSLRQFTLSPWTTESTPGFKGSKIERVGEDVRNAFKTNNRVLLFVDDFVENVIRGDNTIMEEFNLPSDVVVRVIHGGVSAEERAAIQAEYQDRSNPQKIFLIVSGQTADVGVDYSATQIVFHYNEPWTQYRKLQELGRANRPGLAQPLLARTYVTKGTIEEGMHDYILKKYRAVEKLVRGVPLSQLERQLLQEDEKRDDSGLEVNPDLAAYYFSNWDRMMQFFGHTKELGEEKFADFIEIYGKEYAKGYGELGVRSYQANANRVSGTVLHHMIRGGRESLDEIKILDVASGPEMLKRHIDERYKDKIVSVDVNPHHFTQGESETCVVGSWTALPFDARSFNYVNLSLALDQASFIPSKGKSERVEVLKELNRVLKVGGKAVISMIYSVDFKDDVGFQSAISKLGFRMVDDFCGEVSSGSRYSSHLVVLEKMDDVEIESEEKVTGEDLLSLLSTQEREGIKLVQKDSRVRDTRKILTSFEINGRKERIQLNGLDKLVLAEEEDITVQGENLKKLFTRIEAIPPKLIEENGFVRIRVGNKHVLFKKLKRATGVVIVK